MAEALHFTICIQHHKLDSLNLAALNPEI